MDQARDDFAARVTSRPEHVAGYLSYLIAVDWPPPIQDSALAILDRFCQPWLETIDDLIDWARIGAYSPGTPDCIIETRRAAHSALATYLRELQQRGRISLAHDTTHLAVTILSELETIIFNRWVTPDSNVAAGYQTARARIAQAIHG